MWVPARRLLQILDAHPHRLEMLHPAARRRLTELRSGRQRFVSWSATERILISMDLEWLRHIPRDQGGLSDIYEDGVHYGGPDRAHTRRPRPTQRRYETDAERLAARRKSYRDHYRRKKELGAT